MFYLTQTNYIDLALLFVVGLFLDLALKKGAIAFVLAVVAFLIAGYVGVTFLPSMSVQRAISIAMKYANYYVSQVHLGAMVMSLSFIVFVVGFMVGIWKG